MVHSGYHPLKHRPLRIVIGWCTVDIILLNIVLLVVGWCTVDMCPLNSSCMVDSGMMVHSGYHPVKHCPLRIVLGWCTVDIILLNIVLLG